MLSSDKAFDLFTRIANTSGNSKQHLLKGQDVKPYLLATYDPFTMYYATKGWNSAGFKEFDKDTWFLLDALSTRKVTGDEAQIAINIHTSELSYKSNKLFLMILNKDLRMGMGVKTINKVFPGLIPTHDVMLAETYDPDRIRFPCYAGLKIDCVRGIYNPITKKFYSRNGHEYFGLNHIVDEITSGGIEVKIDVELAVKGGKFQWGSGKIRDHNKTPDAVAHIIELPTVKEDFETRLELMKEISYLGEHLLEIHHKLVHSHDEVFDLFKSVRKAGHEGLILRPIDYPYESKRTYNWQKVKNVVDLDLEVIDVYKGKDGKKYEKCLGGVIVKYMCKEPIPTKFNRSGQKVGGGFSDQERLTFWNKPETIIGKTIHVVVTEFTDDMNFRHARMGKQKIREDK